MQWRTILVAIALAFILNACMPGMIQGSSGDSQATSIAMAGTHAAYTLAALPTLTLPPSNTPLPTFTQTTAPTSTKAATKQPSATATNDGTQTAVSTLTQTGVAPISTSGLSLTAPATITSTAMGTATKTNTPTPGPLLYGTVPPSVPYGRVHLINMTNDMVYISFHCLLENGLTSYLEYPVYAKITVSIPAGPCHYVAWVKDRQFTGDIRIKKHLEYIFTFKKQRILISQP